MTHRKTDSSDNFYQAYNTTANIRIPSTDEATFDLETDRYIDITSEGKTPM